MTAPDVDMVVQHTRYRVEHQTSYSYEMPMVDGYTVAHLRPRSSATQVVVDTRLEIDPEPAEFDEFTDLFGNRVVQFGVHRPHTSLVVRSLSEVDLISGPDLDGGVDWQYLAQTTATLSGPAALEIGMFRGSSQLVDLIAHGPQLHGLATQAFEPGLGVIDGARALCHLIHRDYAFDPSATDVATPLGDVIAQRRGVCQDFAHLAIGCLRSLGLPARYVSGYLETDPPPGQPRLAGADMSHAWVSVWAGDLGWVDFDPTNDHLPVRRHVTVGWGRDFADVSPVRGVVIGPASAQVLSVSVSVVRI
jgi:transglutaminase-like putative cysteine protease